MLATQNLSIHVPQRCLIEGLDIAFGAGQNWAILGPNGSGKSLFLKSLAGLDSCASGEVRLGDRPLARHANKQRARLLAILLQEQEWNFPLTVLDAVLAGRYPHLDAWRWESAADLGIARRALAAVGLAGFDERQLNTLSGGELRRVAIAAVLTQDAPISLWDEPTNHLDLRHQTEILAMLAMRAHTPGYCNLFVLHDVNLAVRFCSHVLLLFGDGRFRYGEVKATLNATALQDLYGCEIREIAQPNGPIYLPA